jgi:predicted  nucleic acid-binding Zn-ribbon protein
MADDDDKLEQLLDRLREERDELRVRAHLLKAELRDEWNAAERQWERIEPKLARLRKGARTSSEEVGAAARQLGEEIARSYRRLRDALK